MVLVAFVTDSKCTTCRRLFLIQGSVLANRGLYVPECLQKSTHVLLKMGCLQAGVCSRQSLLVEPNTKEFVFHGCDSGFEFPSAHIAHRFYQLLKVIRTY